MNEFEKLRIIIIIIGLINLLAEIFTLIYSVWITKAIQIIFYIIFSLNVIYYIHAFILSLNIFDEKNKYYLFCVVFIPLILLFNFLFGFIILSINISKYLKYWKYCPYLIKDLDYSLHFERRCELYNINNNSRYSYQFICSYDSSKDFKNKLQNEIKKDNIICIPIKNIKDNNKIISLFNNEYKKIDKYYCSRTNVPDNYTFVNHKNCKKAKYSLMIVFYILSIFRFIFYQVIICIIIIQGLSESNRSNRIRYRNRIRIDRFDDRNHIGRNLHPINNIYNQNNDNIFRNLFRNIININNMNQSINDTKESENPSRINNFNRQKTRNIILENKQEYSIETNVKNILSNKGNTLSNSINLEQINIIINNSERNKINN